MSVILGIWNPPDWHAIEAVGTWVAALGTLAAVVVALWLAQRDVRARRVERRGEIKAMQVGVSRGRIRQRRLLLDNSKAPLYRFPIGNFHRALPKLIADGRLDRNEIDTLVNYEDRVEELNRGLERAGDAARDQDKMPGVTGLQKESERNQREARAIFDDELPVFGNRTLADATETALLRMERVYMSWWGRAVAWWRDP